MGSNFCFIFLVRCSENTYIFKTPPDLSLLQLTTHN